MFTSAMGIRALRGTRLQGAGLSLKRFFAADVVGSQNKLVVNVALPHETLVKNKIVNSVKIQCYEEGDMGVYADHSAFIYTLKPGMLHIEAEDKSNNDYFGFAVMNPDSTLNIFATEAYGLNQLDESLVSKALNEQKVIAESGTSEDAKDAKVRVEVYEAIMKSFKG